MAFAIPSPFHRVQLKGRKSCVTRTRFIALASPQTSISSNVLVVGAGVIGLTTAIRLCEAGHRVTVVALETPSSMLSRNKNDEPSTPYTSSGSGGYWMPFLSTGERLEQWSLRTYDVLEEESARGVEGVTMHDGLILHYKHLPTELPYYAKRTNMRRITHSEDSRVPPAYIGGLHMHVPICRMDDYLPLLERRLLDLGASLRQIADALDISGACEFANAEYDQMDGRKVVVNCTGVGANTFSDDKTVIPGRGVTVRVRRPENAANYFVTEDSNDGILSKNGLLAYCLPRGDEYTLGGTIYENDWNTNTGTSEADEVVNRCGTLIPGIDKWERTGTWTGLRPLRTAGPRLEIEETNGNVTIISNYGHGGSGVTVGWGCAEEVAKIVDELA